jgi:hypothetical protein
MNEIHMFKPNRAEEELLDDFWYSSCALREKGGGS